jgi:hypothetical protein
LVAGATQVRLMRFLCSYSISKLKLTLLASPCRASLTIEALSAVRRRVTFNLEKELNKITKQLAGDRRSCS